MDTKFKNAFEYKVIYIFQIDDETHKGFLKIGDATLQTDRQLDQLSPNCKELNQAALKRIKGYTNTAGVTPKLLHTEVAVRTVREKDGSMALKAFRDHDVHDVLENSGIKHQAIGETTGREWFPVDLVTAKKAIDAVKQNFANLSNADVVHHKPVIFRPEQAECITKVVNHFKKADRFLINAKMRYGKTFVSLEIVKQCRFKKTIILTHRPVVDQGWYDDFTVIFYGQDHIYGSKTKGNTLPDLLEKDKPFIYFASIQDLRGSAEVGGKFDKNDDVFKTVWDCVIVDEAHEGTTTTLGEDTVKAVFKEGSGTKLLALSGTPFNILTDYDEDSIYTWDYIMEQECKSEWDKLHFGDHNPYDELPELRIYTYSLGDILHNSNYITFEDKAFNFHEFFRTFTGDFSVDYADMPDGAETGDFIHEADVWSFLNLMAKEDDQSQYPFSNDEYRSLFKHTLWMVPGVKEARALKKLMLKHPVFGSGQFDIVNVAGSGDEEEKAEEALSKVRKAIKSAKKLGTYTITLSCGKLTTGVTVKEWTAVFMLSGTYSTSAANYLQTIFRVQSPCNEDGKIKETAYVFDFAPDRTLKMVSSAVQISSRVGKTRIGDKQVMGKFLNYCPVIAVTGSEMQEYSAAKLLQQLKRAYADKVVRNGFDDANLYNDELLKLDQIDIKKFEKLKGIIGTSKAAPKTNDITVNDQGLTNEEYEEQERLKKKKKKELTPEEKARLEELKKKRKIQNDAISILRGISIRMPLLIYGADIPYDEEITLDRFVDAVDNSSWEEFMPNRVTKKLFRDFQKYYDEEVFIAAGRRIRNIAKEADTLDPTERVMKIAGLFTYFKNPDKETVLTPWRVVNMHMSDCLGGWCFYDETFAEENKPDAPRFVDRGKVTEDVFGNPDAKILEINSKTGLYPLYIAYSAYRRKLMEHEGQDLSPETKKDIWKQAVQENVYVICKTPMAKAITQRTLLGYSNEKINAHYFDNIVNIVEHKPQQFLNKVSSSSYWKKGKGKMKFDAIVANPPYMMMDQGYRVSATPIYNYFVEQAIALAPNYISMVIPARWFAGGKGLDSFRDKMLHDDSLCKIVDFPEATECFTGVQIKGGIFYFLWDKSYSGDCSVTTHLNGKVSETVKRPLLENGNDIFIRYNEAVSILYKVQEKGEPSFEPLVSTRRPFGFDTLYQGKAEGEVVLYNNQETQYVQREDIARNIEWVDQTKVFIPESGSGSDSFPHPILGKPFLGKKGTACTETYLVIGPFENESICRNVISYIQTRFFRFLVLLKKPSQHATSKVYSFVPVQDFTKAWTDKELYKKYNLSAEDISFIESMVKEL